MKLLHIIATINPAGGGPIEGLRQLRIPLVERGVQVDVCCGDDPAAPYVRDSELSVIALGPSKGIYTYNRRLIPWLRENGARYDAVIVEGLWQFHGLATWLTLRGKVPFFVFTHGMLDPWFKTRYPLKHLKKWFYWMLVERKVLRDADAALFTCDEERRRARLSFPLYRCTERIASYGTAQPPLQRDALRAAFHAAFPQTEGKRIVLFFGRLHEKKGCDLLIDAFARVAAEDPALQLVMAGPGAPALQQQLAAQAKHAGIADRVVWTGMLSGDCKWGAFHAAEVFCLPSHQENFGVAVVEALGCGVPVLISDKVNIWREIEADGAGIVQPDTVDGTERSLRQWLSASAARRDAMRTAAPACFSRRFQSRQVGERLLNIIQGRPEGASSETDSSGAVLPGAAPLR
ncbi:glycosyltransferase involved in cell wall biosynthesis [Cupriavidus gilardii J11]|uniref:Glycosyltransferase involved in cell wall biosynthesis n=1 Tax=Cupriavidus gilardii J11 TaxID=936133 RepID=A0A562B887_9BURK|nr:glycosyltransferase [Cupriavidus gilardii]TWG81415.1 glycosyltransferase involved in cell wall biosynthesis [Cupriavidus gilardii J11]